jgi:hypothetical protein
VQKHGAALASREQLSIRVTAPERVPMHDDVEQALSRVVTAPLTPDPRPRPAAS